MNLKRTAQRLIGRLPHIGKAYTENLQFRQNSCFPAGHFYSPIISVDEIKKKEGKIWEKEEAEGVSGIRLNTDRQLALLRELSAYYEEMPFKAGQQDGMRFFFENEFYSYTDGIVLYSMIRHFRPKRIIEIGSGFSSALMLDTNDFFFGGEIKMTFIEPYTERLWSLMSEEDLEKQSVIQSDVQAVPLSIFEELEAGDFLFVDSTHVVKTGSDVNYILFEILPVLQSGVLIHFHDVFYPFEYPREWVMQGRNWNEDYFLRAFLMYNDKFEIRLFTDYIQKLHQEGFKDMPLSRKESGGNLWLEKTRQK